MKAAETGRENAAPTSGEGAGASTWADTPAITLADNTTAATRTLFIMLLWAIFVLIRQVEN